MGGWCWCGQGLLQVSAALICPGKCLGKCPDGLGVAFACERCPDAAFALELLWRAPCRHAAGKHAARILQPICALQSCYITSAWLVYSSLLV